MTRRVKGNADFSSPDGGYLRERNQPFTTFEVSRAKADTSDQLAGSVFDAGGHGCGAG